MRSSRPSNRRTRTPGRQRYPDHGPADFGRDDAERASSRVDADRRPTGLRRVGAVVAELPIRRIVRWGVPALVVLVALLAVAYLTPAFAARNIRVEGLVTMPEQQVRDVLEIPDGRSMLRIDTGAVARRVAALPKVHSVRVQRSFPATVRVTVDERTPLTYFDGPQGAHLLDADSVEYAVEPPPSGLPKLTTAHPAGDDPVTRAAVTVLDAAPPELRAQVGEVVARSVSDIELKLTDGRSVVWGGAGDSMRKAAVVVPVLTRPGTVFDVSSPDLVTVK